uniref:Uncharacterized protein n=1 Tax=Anopheles culicifacies TaxID=139723 RepID=A0A182M7C2_9DIPT
MYIQNTLKSFFGGEPKDLPSKTPFGEVDIGLDPNFGTLYATASTTFPTPAAADPTVPPKKHRSSLTGLSKYGPWGYLFLGMLICGGALLICGLWECCCRSHKPEPNVEDSLPDQVPSFLQTSAPTDSSRPGAQADSPAVGHNLPQYGELDPPPAYSVLFPAQKPSDNGNELPVTSETAQTTNNSPSVSDSSHNSSDAVSRTADEESLVVATVEVPPVPV